MIETKGDIMCMPHQKPAKAQTRDIRGNKKERRKVIINRQEFEKGDKSFIDERKSIIQSPQKKRGFFDKLFS